MLTRQINSDAILAGARIAPVICGVSPREIRELEIANLVLEYVKVLIYPSLIGMAVVLFRKELSLLLSGKFTAKYKDLTIMLERQREELEASERKSKIAAATMSSIKENNEEKGSSNTTINEIISILELKPNEYSVVEFLASKESSLTSKSELIERFSKGVKSVFRCQICF